MPTQETPTPRLDGDACYAALLAHDARFDGRFFVGVSSTGVYCRPICRVKPPKKDNCSFFVSAAAAEESGYRPCLKCRPELAPGLSAADAAPRLARRAAALMEEGDPDDRTLDRLAGDLGITDRHLRRVFFAEFGVSPVRYLQTRKLLLAKNLLTDTRLSVTAAAMAAGFGSIRRFNDLFRRRYGMTPGRLRKLGGDAPGNDEGFTLSIGYRPPFAWDKLIAFLAGRTIPGIEETADGAYRRTVSIREGNAVHSGWLTVANRPERHALAVTVAPTLLPVLARVLTRVRLLFDVNCPPAEVEEKLAGMNSLAPGMVVPGLRLPGCFDPFEMAVRAILGQQVTVKAARTLAGRFAGALGETLATPFPTLNRIFPSPETILALEPPVEGHLGPLGITRVRARAILALAGALSAGDIRLTPGADPEREMAKLLELPGFGDWTAQYIGMRAFGWPDAFPHTDYGVKAALPGRTPAAILALSQAWRPWRSYATMMLWNSLTEKPPAPAAAG